MTKTLNMRNVYVILITVARVFLTDTVTKRCRRCRTMNIPFERKKKRLVGKGEREVNNNNKLLCLIFLKYIFELMINTA